MNSTRFSGSAEATLFWSHVRGMCAGKTIVRMSQYIIVAFGCFMGVMAIILLEIGLNLG